jgi:tRNA nucleotidyltransferase/poly(A) polymerase
MTTNDTPSSLDGPPLLPPTIQLSEREARVFEILRRTGDKLGTTVRVAGGWVRDKLLLKAPDDVDVALDNCSGTEFANAVQEMLRCEGCEQMGKVTVIKANPDQVGECVK